MQWDLQREGGRERARERERERKKLNFHSDPNGSPESLTRFNKLREWQPWRAVYQMAGPSKSRDEIIRLR